MRELARLELHVLFFFSFRRFSIAAGTTIMCIIHSSLVYDFFAKKKTKLERRSSSLEAINLRLQEKRAREETIFYRNTAAAHKMQRTREQSKNLSQSTSDDDRCVHEGHMLCVFFCARGEAANQVEEREKLSTTQNSLSCL